MEFIFEPTYGAPFSMEVPARQTVLDLKDKIQALRRIHVSRQALIFKETHLNDDDFITLPPLSHIKLVITLVLPLSPESMESPFPDGPETKDKKIRLYLRVPALKIWASLEMDPKDSVLGLKRKVQQLTEEIPTLGKKIEQLLQCLPDIKKKLQELRGDRRGNQIPWEMINLRHQNGSELGDSGLLHDCGLGNRSEVIMSLHGLPHDCTLASPLPEPPTTNALNDQELSVWVKLKLSDREWMFKLVVKATDKVGVIWYALQDRAIDLQKNAYFYWINGLMGGRALNRELTFRSCSVKEGDKIFIVPWLNTENQDMHNRFVLGLYL